MTKVGTNISKGYKKCRGKGSPFRRITGAIRFSTAIVLVLTICTIITATIPVHAMVVNDADTSSATGSPATCPCKSQGSSQSVAPAVQPQAVDASVLNQLAQSTYNPGETAQQVAAYTPQYSTTTVPVSTANLNTITPVNVQNGGNTETAGVAPTAGFSNLFSRWMNDEIGSSAPGNSLKEPAGQMLSIAPMYSMNGPMTGNYPGYTANGPTAGINPLFSGWQMGPLGTEQARMQASWLNGPVWN